MFLITSATDFLGSLENAGVLIYFIRRSHAVFYLVTLELHYFSLNGPR
jgi:hypothetical protein